MIGPAIKGARWLLKNAERSKVKAFREFLQNNPKIAAIGTGYGVYEILDIIETTQDVAGIAALNEAAAKVGVDLEAVGSQIEDAADSTVMAAKSVGNSVSTFVGVGPVFDTNTVVSKADAARDESLTALARFLRGEVSGNPGYLFRYWQMMGTFLRMDEASVKNFLGGAYFK